MTFIKNSMAYSVIGLLILLSLNTYAANNQSELNQLRNQIKVQDASIKKQHRYLNDLSKQTQSTDRSISKVAAQLSNTESLITNIEQDLSALVIKQKALLKRAQALKTLGKSKNAKEMANKLQRSLQLN
jgi:septal ring factor EnvC (AmiA/AmiB activator)